MSTTTDIECPRCHRLDFATAPHHSCQGCHWTIRPKPVDKPYGYDLLIEVRSGTMIALPIIIEKHFKGSASAVKNSARRLHNFRRVLAIVPLDEETYRRAYGEGRM